MYRSQLSNCTKHRPRAHWRWSQKWTETCSGKFLSVFKWLMWISAFQSAYNRCKIWNIKGTMFETEFDLICQECMWIISGLNIKQFVCNWKPNISVIIGRYAKYEAPHDKLIFWDIFLQLWAELMTVLSESGAWLLNLVLIRFSPSTRVKQQPSD